MTVNKQVTDVVSYFKQMFHIDGTSGKKAKQQEGHLQEQIRETQSQLQQIQDLQPIIQKIIALLVAVAAVYLIGSAIGGLVHWIAIGVLVVGIYKIVNNG
jgi:ABC-type transport system involved in cytochrome bd biosynthesis fused ATPase/permease subunit